MAEFLIKPYKGVIWDFDGTLVDTTEFNRTELITSLEQLGLERSLEKIDSAMHYPWTICVERLLGDDYQSYGDRFKDLVVANIRENSKQIKIFPGVLETLENYRHNKLPLAIVSSRDGASIKIILETTELGRHFDAVVFEEMVKDAPKPHPWPSLLACKMLGIVPEEVCGIGDSPTDIESFQGAGAGQAVAVTFGYTKKKKLLKARPDQVVHNYTQINRIISEGLRRIDDDPVIWPKF